MAWEIPGQTISLEAAADLSTKQFYFVKLDTNGRAALCAAATDRPIGILQNKPSALGRMASVMVNGISKVIGGADLAKADQVGTDANGKAAAYVPGTDTTKYIVGQVLDDNSADGEVATIQFDCRNAGRAA